MVMQQCQFRLVVWFFLSAMTMAGMGAPVIGYADVVALDARTVADSPEDFARRLYSYDMAVDAANDVHIVASKPRASKPDEVVYIRRTGGIWRSEVSLSIDGLRSSISTRIAVDNAGDVHVCYIKSSDRNLYYRKIVDGVPRPESQVAQGAWHTLMQLDSAGRPMFLRESETWPAQVSKLALLTTTNGTRWSSRLLDLPSVPRFRLAEFRYESGRYHLAFGDSKYRRQVLLGKGSSSRKTGIFHGLYYASSTDGRAWSTSLIDNSATLYEDEFWTTLALDGAMPIVGLYRYAEIGDQYNTGTSALIANREAGQWRKIIVQDRGYEETREGASLAVIVDRPGHWLGIWDYSPDNTFNAYFRGERGNLALARSGPGRDWREKIQLQSFSAEGRVVVQQHPSQRLHLLVLGDFVDAKLYYREFDMTRIEREFDRVFAKFPWNNFLPAIIRATQGR
ncbi:MAG: hypothetical protein K9L70_08125 [Thiohalocapsa sp.]|nr:hypothetical protein [Thiohalocapsa sp.]